MTDNEVFLLFAMTLLSQNLKFTVMKTLIKNAACLIILLLTANFTGFGQEYIKLERSMILPHDLQSKIDGVLIKVSDEYNYLKVKVQGQVNKGDILVELVDPEGEVRRNFTLKTSSAAIEGIDLGEKGYVAGEMEKSYRNPPTGNWLVRVTYNPEANGKIKVNSLLIYNPRADLIELEQIEKDTDEHIYGQL